MLVRRAILSVSDKAGIVEFAQGLSELGVEILSTGGTSKILRENGVDAIDIADYTGFPEILDGRLKTLHPFVHGGILGLRYNPKHQEEMEANQIEPIDMVVVNLYPFEQTIAKPECSLEEAIENVDIGGPTMVRAAAKNYKHVSVIVDPEDYEPVLSELVNSNGTLSEDVKFKLAQKAFAHTAHYDSAICNYLNAVEDGEKKDLLPSAIGFAYKKVQDLRYGENPHQRAAFYSEYIIKEPCVAGVEQLHGKELSYNNIMDTDAAVEIVKDFDDQIFTVILKHTNPCGAAVSEESLTDAFKKAKATDPVSSFGGIVGFSRDVDESTAAEIAETFFEVIVAPGYSDEALAILMKKKNIRLLKLAGLGKPFVGVGWNTRKVVGGMLVQDRDLESINVRECRVATGRTPSDEETKALSFAWKICKYVKSNAIIYTSKDQLLGVGAGQMSRVDSAKIARMKMEESFGKAAIKKLKPIVCASDAFFPFRDGIDAAAAAGATAIIQPGGSKRDSESIEAADEHNISMLFTGMRHFKH